MPRSKVNQKTGRTKKPLLQMNTLVFIRLVESEQTPAAPQPKHTRRMQSFQEKEEFNHPHLQ
jgi:hypothetical protein